MKVKICLQNDVVPTWIKLLSVNMRSLPHAYKVLSVDMTDKRVPRGISSVLVANQNRDSISRLHVL